MSGEGVDEVTGVGIPEFGSLVERTSGHLISIGYIEGHGIDSILMSI